MQKKLTALILVVALFATTLPALAGVFPDVPDSHWATNSVETLAELGIFLGYPDGEFRGKQPATRYELAVVVHRAWQKLIDAMDDRYVKVGSTPGTVVPAEETLKALIEEQLAAKDYVTRAEAEKIAEAKAKEVMNNFLKLTDDVSPELGNMGVDVAKLRALCNQLDTRVTDLESRLAALDNDFRNYQQKMNAKCDMMEDLKAQVDLLSKRPVGSGNGVSAEYLAAYEKQLLDYGKRLDGLDGTTGKLQTTVDDHEKRITQLEGTVDEHDMRLSAIEDRLNKYRFNAAARLISEGVNTYDLDSFWIRPDALNNWVSLGDEDVFRTGSNLALGFDVGLNVKPDPRADLVGNFTGFFSGSKNGVPRSWRFNGLAQLDKYQVGASYLTLSPQMGVYANSLLLDGLLTGELGDAALRNYQEASLFVGAAPLSFISRWQGYNDAQINTQELIGGTTLPYDVELDASYKLQTTEDGGSEHAHRIIRAAANRAFDVYNYPLAVTFGVAQRYGKEDDDSFINKYFLDANLAGIKPIENLDLNVFFQALENGSTWEGDFDEKSFGTAEPALFDQLARVWNKDERHLAIGTNAAYQIIDDLYATGSFKFDLNPKNDVRETTVGVGAKYSFDLANFALPNYYVTTSFDFEKIKELGVEDAVGNRLERAVLLERPLSQTSGFFGSWRLINGSRNLKLDDSTDRYITVGYGTDIAGAKFRVFYNNLASDVVNHIGDYEPLKTMDRLVVDLLYAF